MVYLKVNNLGVVEVVSMEWEFQGDGLCCVECGSDNVAEIGKRKVY